MDLYEFKIRSQHVLSGVRALSWKDPDQRKVLVLLTGAGLLVVLLPIAAWMLLAPAVTTSQAERAADLNEVARASADTPISTLERLRDRFSPRMREDTRFASVLIRPGASAGAPDAVATLQGSVNDQAAFDALVALLNEHELLDAVHVRVSIEPTRPRPAPSG